MSDYGIIFIAVAILWTISSCGESRNSTVNTVILGISAMALIFLRIFKVI
ncbi:hypothetical protein [Lactobacillus crispatus]|nr:hypothetical protein [Lactobacillus crispatus]DAJ15670.1 MAG TPA: hypothetical protein [Siphoviridae sp. ctBfm1]